KIRGSEMMEIISANPELVQLAMFVVCLPQEYAIILKFVQEHRNKMSGANTDFRLKIETALLDRNGGYESIRIEVVWSAKRISADNIGWPSWLKSSSGEHDRSLDEKLVMYGYCLDNFGMTGSLKFDDIHWACFTESVKNQCKRDPFKI